MKRVCLIALAALAAAAPHAAGQVRLNGAGATFPNLIYQNWIITYNQKALGAELNYQSIGSGGGIRQFSDKTVDFGTSDAPMTDSAITAIGGNVLHIPTVLGAVVPAYNLPGLSAPIRFTPAILADIFLGKLTKRKASQSVRLAVPRFAARLVLVGRREQVCQRHRSRAKAIHQLHPARRSQPAGTGRDHLERGGAVPHAARRLHPQRVADHQPHQRHGLGRRSSRRMKAG
ncbi:MAG: hypothetical protein EXR93_04900 [Gemmatimonadetes bacterium]|nr:hypothetical protein [Gemmatimonadota bacterium]